MRLGFLVMLAVGGIVLVGGCIQSTNTEDENKTGSIVNDTSGTDKDVGAGVPEWMQIELKDIVTGETFRIADFAGKPIILESFAVWCSTCLRQQREVRALKSQTGDSIVHISLDTDPNEDEETVRNHLKKHGFDWYYAIAPTELTNALIDEFGLDVVNAPLAPVILVCEDLKTRFLPRGVKSAAALESATAEGC